MMAIMKKANSGSSKANNHAPNALPPKKRPAPDALPLPLSPDDAAAMATRMLAEAERAAARAENNAALQGAGEAGAGAGGGARFDGGGHHHHGRRHYQQQQHGIQQ